MSHKLLSEAVSQYLDSVGGTEEEYLSVLGGHRRELESLISAIRLLRAVLVPVEPSPEFVIALKAGLMTTPASQLQPESASFRRRLIVQIAAALSVLSAATIVVMCARARARAA